MDLKKLGELLQARRETLGIPAAVLARKADISRSTLWIVERGENPRTGNPSKLSKDKLERWVLALEMDPAEQAEVLELAGYGSDPLRLSKGSQVDVAPSIKPSLSVLAAPPLPKREHSLSQRIEHLISSAGLTEQEAKLVSERLIAVAYELISLLKSTRGLDQEPEGRSSEIHSD